MNSISYAQQDDGSGYLGYMSNSYSGLGFLPIIMAAIGPALSVAGAAIQPDVKLTVLQQPETDKKIPVYLISGAGILLLLVLILNR